MITVSVPQILSGSFTPDYFDKKDISWTVGDNAIIQVDAGFVEEGIADGDYRNAKVMAKKDTRWILDLMEADDAAHAEHIYEKRTGYGTRSTDVIMAAKDALGDVMDQVVDVNGIKLLATSVDGVDMNGLRDLGDSLKEKLGEGVIVLASSNEGKVNLVAMATDAAIKSGAHAGNLIKAIASKVGGGGGGRPNMAQAGGKNPAGIPDAIASVKDALSGMIK